MSRSREDDEEGQLAVDCRIYAAKTRLPPAWPCCASFEALSCSMRLSREGWRPEEAAAAALGWSSWACAVVMGGEVAGEVSGCVAEIMSLVVGEVCVAVVGEAVVGEALGSSGMRSTRGGYCFLSFSHIPI